MIFGIGIDVQEIAQIREIVNRRGKRFIERVFTPSEITYCQKYKDPVKHYAARWAIKEAFLKAMGKGIAQGYSLQDIETINLSSGKPIVQVQGKLKEDCSLLGISSFSSISHSGNYAVGQILLYKESCRF